jgi:hypothetical protein
MTMISTWTTVCHTTIEFIFPPARRRFGDRPAATAQFAARRMVVATVTTPITTDV